MHMAEAETKKQGLGLWGDKAVWRCLKETYYFEYKLKINLKNKT